MIKNYKFILQNYSQAYTEILEIAALNKSNRNMNCSLMEPNCNIINADNVRNDTLDNGIILKMQQLTWAGTITYVVISIILLMLILSGNILIMIAFGMNKSLRTLSNYFLVSLAVADFFTGLISLMPFAVYASLAYWPFGEIACDLWVTLDNGITMSSTLHMLVICLDRYMAVKWPLTYRARRSKRKVFIVIAAVWIISFLFWMPMLGLLRSDRDNIVNFTNECYLSYLDSNYYVFIAIGSAVVFWLPCVVMVGLYLKVYQATLKHKSFILKHVRGRTKYINQSSNNDKIKVSVIGAVSESETNFSNKNEASAGKIFTNPFAGRHFKKNRSTATETAKAILESTTDNYKAAKMLTAIIIAYIITWIPWKSFMIIYYFCKDCIPSTVFYFVYLLVFVNSTVNPFLYAVCNKHFKRTFVEILMYCLKKRA